MGKVTKLGSLPPDDPIFSGGVEMFSPHAFRPSSTSSAKSTDGETQDKSSSAPAGAHPMQPAADLYEQRMMELLTAKDKKDPSK